MGGLVQTPVQELLTEARLAGLEVAADGNQLRIRGPKSAAHLAQALADRKEEVLAYLSCPHPRLLPETQAAGRCLRCMEPEQYLRTVRMLGERHRREKAARRIGGA